MYFWEESAQNLVVLVAIWPQLMVVYSVLPVRIIVQSVVIITASCSVLRVRLVFTSLIIHVWWVVHPKCMVWMGSATHAWLLVWAAAVKVNVWVVSQVFYLTVVVYLPVPWATSHSSTLANLALLPVLNVKVSRIIALPVLLVFSSKLALVWLIVE